MGKSEILVTGEVQAVGEYEMGIQPGMEVSHCVDIRPGLPGTHCHS